MQFIDERNGRLIEELRRLSCRHQCRVQGWRMACTGERRLEPEALEGIEWQDFEEQGVWGGHNTYYWFEAQVELSPEFEGLQAVLELCTGREGSWDATNPQFRVYVNGALRQGLDVNHREVLLSREAAAGETFHIQLSAFTGNQNFCLELKAQLKAVDRRLENLYYDLETPRGVLELLEPESSQAMAIRKALTRTLDLIDLRKPYSQAFFESLSRGEEYLREEFYGRECGGSRETVWTVGHTHIDVAWLWTLAVTRDKAVRSFSSALELMDQYPEFVFMSSQPQLYRYVKEDAPEIYERIRQRVRQGRWEAEGGMFLEADCNLTSGESLVRQFLYGKRFFKEEFGVDSQVLWLPDVFGYSAALPQIMKKCGIRYFMTTKISWSETDRMPFDTFLWEGMDGTRILTHFITARDYNASLFVEGKKRPPHFTTYNGNLNPSQTKGTWQRYSQKELSSQALMCFGHGDGGGGPTRKMLEYQRRLSRGIPGCPATRMAKAGEFFEALEEQVRGREDLLAWVGELYLEYHRGTYTSMARNKRWNRKGEFLLGNLERLASMALARGEELPGFKREMEELWEILLRNQFHDILPGSSCGEVYEDSREEYRELFERGRAIKERLLDTLSRGSGAPEGSLLVFNLNPFEDTGPVRCAWPGKFKRPGVMGPDGKLRPIQRTEEGDGIFLAGQVPGTGTAVFELWEMEEEPLPQVRFDGELVQTPFFSLRLNEAGQFVSFVDRRTGRELLKPGQRGNRLVTYEDRPHYYDAWDINEYYVKKPYPVEEKAQITVAEEGPVRTVVRVVHRYLSSEIRQDLIFYPELGRIDMEYCIDWRESNILLRTYFPADIHAWEAAYEIQYGNVMRPTHKNTSWDQAKFEVCAHKWVDLSEDGYGLSVLNDCKYGCDIHDGVVGLTLLKSAVYPNPDADREVHRFSYSLYPHLGGWREAGVIPMAYGFNNPMMVREKAGKPGRAAAGASLAAVDCPNMVLEAVKPAEDGEGLILRMYEAFNRSCEPRLTLGFPVRAAWLCDLLENREQELTVQEDGLRLCAKPYEILTVRVLPGRGTGV